MKIPTLPEGALPSLAGALLLALSLFACDTVTAEATGSRGAPCEFQEDCALPTVCAKTGEYEWTICTGTVPQGGACTSPTDCRFERSDGLPLDCLAGTCGFPAASTANESDAVGDSGSDASEEPNG